jgi:hypothetical protein
MTHGFVIPCALDVTRGRIKHGWLENEILAGVRGRRELWLKLRSAGRSPEAFGSLAVEMGKLKQFVSAIVEGYSPRQLVDQPPFTGLAAETRSALGEAVNEVYLERSNVLSRRRTLEGAEKSFGDAAASCLATWDRAYSETEAIVALEALESATLKLIAEMDCWRDGVVLP